LIAVHGRTKEQRYTGDANWDAIAEVKSLVNIPVIGSGDVKTVVDIDRMKNHTHVDAVMIGRGAIANPWIFARIDRGQVTPQMMNELVCKHLARCVEFYGDEDGSRLFRTHSPAKNARKFSSRVHRASSQKCSNRSTPSRHNV
jgi:tRNA-dihydrouridine synthase